MRHCTMSRIWIVVCVTTILGLVRFSVNRAAEPAPEVLPAALPAELSADVAALKAEITRL